MIRSGILSAALVCVAACMPYGFNGGGLPSSIRTVAVAQFANQTATSELPREISDALQTRLRERLGLRDDTPQKANALVRGTIQRYEIDIPVGYSATNKAATTATRALQLSVDIEMIDQTTGKTLWQQKGIVAQAQYQEGGEDAARLKAVDQIVTRLIEGAQSQW